MTAAKHSWPSPEANLALALTRALPQRYGLSCGEADHTHNSVSLSLPLSVCLSQTHRMFECQREREKQLDIFDIFNAGLLVLLLFNNEEHSLEQFVYVA